jgi:hypothetical protein
MHHKIDILLEEIARIILVTGDFSKNTGLFLGQSGAAMFLYNYYNYRENEYYASFADELVLSISQGLDEDKVFYSDGVTGIAWAMSYMASADFIDLSVGDAIFDNVDKALLKSYPRFFQTVESAGICAYLYERLKNYNKESQGELIELLFIEKLVAHIEEIALLEGNKAPFTKRDLSEMLEDSPKATLAKNAEKYFSAAVVLRNARQYNIYEEMVNRLSVVIATKLTSIINGIHLFLEENEHPNPVHIGHLQNQLLICFNAWLQLCAPEQEMTRTFISSLMKMENYIVMSTGGGPENLNVPVEVTCITLINTINLALDHPLLKDTAHAKVTRLVDFLGKGANLVDQFVLNPVTLNIGVTGLAGLGLMLLDYVLPEKTKWEKALMYN